MAIATLALLLGSPVRAQENCPVLDLTGPMRQDALAGYVGVLEDADHTFDPAVLAGTGTGFMLLRGASPDFGYTASNVWLRLCLRNKTDITDWRLKVNENFFQKFAVYLARSDGTLDTVENLESDSPFSARPVSDPELIAPFKIGPGEAVTLLVAYRSGGASQMDFSLETRDSYMKTASRRTAKNFIFYGMMLLLVTVAMVSFLVLRHVVFLAYAFYALAILLFVMHGDGTAFQYLWPAFPGFNGNASVFIGGSLIVFGSIYARVFLKTGQRHPVFDRLLWGIILLTPVLIAALVVPNPQLLKKLLIMLSLGSILVFTSAGLVAYFSGYREVRFYTLAWVGGLVSSGLMNLRHVVGLEIPQEAIHDSIRIVMVLDALMMGLAIADRYNQMRRSRQTALEDSLKATRQQLDLNQRLAELQASHDLAVELSKSRDRHIQNVVHDLRQPLHALRLNVMNLSAEGSNTRPQTVEAAFSYLETLIGEHLEPAKQGTPVPDGQPDAVDETSTGHPGLRDILSAVTDMFQPDAAKKGLSLRLVHSRMDLPVAEALVLTRIVSNLASNAIKYTDSGGVLIGMRRRGAGMRVEIHDTGPGMTEAEFQRASQRNVRLKAPATEVTGKGLGLAIAINLAARHDMRIVRLTGRHTGTGLGLIIPVKEDF